MSNEKNASESAEIHNSVRDYYANIVESKPTYSACGCSSNNMGSSSCCGDKPKIYEDPDVNNLPNEVTDISLGCGDPITLASLRPGQTVLDLGSGGGIDCFLAAQKVGSTGRVIGVDMTPQMLDRARANREKIGADNVEFRLGEIEHLPVENGSVDVVISNCVINLSPDKPQVFKEIYRVLKPGGRIAVSDIVTQGELPEEIRKSLVAWAGCVSGAVDVSDYQDAIEKAGFVNVKIVPVYLSEEMVDDAIKQIDPSVLSGLDRETAQKSIFSAKITAEKI
jgi:arsenite methyltransferase